MNSSRGVEIQAVLNLAVGSGDVVASVNIYVVASEKPIHYMMT